MSLRRARALAAAVAIVASAAGTVHLDAQVRRPPTGGVKGLPRGGKKSDSARKEIVHWRAADSVMLLLQAMPGYSHIRWQADSTSIDPLLNIITFIGHPAAVERDGAVLIGDTIVYDKEVDTAVIRGDTIVIRDPTRYGDDFVARKIAHYDRKQERVRVEAFRTSYAMGTDTWLVEGQTTEFKIDPLFNRRTYWVRNGTITTCDDSFPDYYLRAKRLKLVSDQFLFSGPAVLYISDVPVFWLPFFFADTRSGRHGGMLPLRLSATDVVRTSPNFRRRVDNLGYFFVVNDYLDAKTYMDWKSGARATDADPGYTKVGGEINYKWIDRFVEGNFLTEQTWETSGATTLTMALNHSQAFSQSRRLTANLNYVSNTRIQQQTLYDPIMALASIRSQLAYTHRLGDVTLSLGGNRQQYPGRPTIDQNFPNFSLSSPTIPVTSWMEWTPSVSLNNQENYHIAQTGAVPYRFFVRNGVRDSSKVDASVRQTNVGFESPIRLWGFTLSNSFSIRDQENDFPDLRIIVDPRDTTIKTTRVYAKTFSTDIDWNTSLSLPTLLSGTLKLTPTVAFVNVDPSGFWFRSEQSGGAYVNQTKRIRYGVSAAPTLYGFFPGVGPIEALRHSITPQISYNRSPKAEVSDAFLAAKNETRGHYIGDLAQDQISLTLSQSIEAKLKAPEGTPDEEVKKIRLISLNTSSLTYDLERARVTGRSGFATDFFRYDVASDLLPGFSFGVNYSLFQGSVLSDTAQFKPFRQGINASLGLTPNSAIVVAIGRLLGWRGQPPTDTTGASAGTSGFDTQQAPAQAAVTSIRDRSLSTLSRDWRATLSFTDSRQRPPVGGNVISFDPREQCLPYQSNPITYNQCLIAAQSGAIATSPITATTAGAPFILLPGRRTMQGHMNFPLTSMWTLDWETTYDFTNNEFASHTVQLQRDLHDWRANFYFSRAPNGSFLFTFDITLKANSDVRFPYQKSSYSASQ